MSILRRLGKLKVSEKAILKELYLDYRPMLYKTIIQITKDEEITEDIIHNTFIKASDKLNNIDNITDLKKWMMTVAKNEAIDYHKLNKKIQVSEMIDDLNATDNLKSVPEDHIENLEELKLLNNSLHDLSPKYRSVVYYKVIKELPFKQIALILGKKENTLRSQYKRALNKLKVKLRR